MVKGWIGFTMIYPYWGMVINPFIDIVGHPPYGTPWGIPLVSLKLPCWFQSPPGWLNGQAWWELWGWSNVTWVKQDSKESRKETGISCTSEFETGSRWFNGSSLQFLDWNFTCVSFFGGCECELPAPTSKGAPSRSSAGEQLLDVLTRLKEEGLGV